MATGMELLLAAAMCVNCPPLSKERPPGFIDFNNYDNLLDDLLLMEEIDVPLNYLNYQGPDETLVTLLEKIVKLYKIARWVNGRHLRIGTLEDYPLSYTEVLGNGTRIGRGISFEIIEFLRQKYNFTYEVVLPKINIIGSDTDFDNSLIALINNSAVDMAAAFIPILSAQRSFIAYSHTPLEEGEWMMVMQRPRESADGSGVLAPFDFWVWILILSSFLTVGPIIYMLVVLRRRLTGDPEQRLFALNHCMWFVYGALVKQGTTLSPTAVSTRLLFATWWIFITILTSFYTANLTAFLTLNQFTLPYNTVHDILRHNKRFVTTRGGGIEYSIRTVNESLYMLNSMFERNVAVLTEVGDDTYNLLNYVENQGYVFVRDRPAITELLYQDYMHRRAINRHSDRLNCPFAVAKQPFLTKKRAFAYPIGSNLSQLFDAKLLNLVEAGIVKYLLSKSLPLAEICPLQLSTNDRQLRNRDLKMTYYIMFVGLVTALTVFSTELLFRFINSRREANEWTQLGKGSTLNGLSKQPKRWQLRLPNWRCNRHTVESSMLKQNATPPPAYQSIYMNAAGTLTYGIQRWPAAARAVAAPPPIEQNAVRRTINGRDYMVLRKANGQSQLVPLRSPSALLFQFTYPD